MSISLPKINALLRGQVIKNVYNNSCFRGDQICIELASGLIIQLTYEHPIINLKAIKVGPNTFVDEEIYNKIIGPADEDKFNDLNTFKQN